MRIICISNYYPPYEIGGWEQLLRDIVNRLRTRGHEVLVLSSDYGTDEPAVAEPQVERVFHLESPDHVTYHPRYSIQRRTWEEENKYHLRRTVEEFKPDVIYINGMWNLPVSLAHEAERILPGNVVYYMASLWPIEEDAHKSYWVSPPNKVWAKPLKQVLNQVVDNLFLDDMKRNQLDFPRVLCVSDFIRQQMIEDAGIPSEQIYVVHNGVELDDFAMRDLSSADDVVRIVYAGRLTPEKGVHTVVEALSIFVSNDPSVSVSLSIVGGGPSAYEHQLRKLVQNAHLEEFVNFTGQVPREQMPEILTEHDILVLPSIWQEPLARIAQEAMACGLVVVATTTGGTAELIDDGDNGVLFEAGDAEMLASKIDNLATDRQLRFRLAKSGRKTVEERFSFERMVDEIEQHLRQVNAAGLPIEVPFSKA